MGIVTQVQTAVSRELKSLYNAAIEGAEIPVNETKPEFEGEYTVVLFALLKSLKKSPDTLGNELGTRLLNTYPRLFSAFNVIKGFLNLSIADEYWLNLLSTEYHNDRYGYHPRNNKRVMIEYSSPNTNKPLHLGHLRNNFLGWSIAEIYKASGYDVIKTCIVNDRGVHICKSMLAWQKFSNGATPATTGIKGDHLVGDYYVMFENELKKQTEPVLAAINEQSFAEFSEEEKQKLTVLARKLAETGLDQSKQSELQDEIREIARNHTPIMQEVREMLLRWENNDPDTIALWKRMNSWVYDGFDITYKRIGSDFDKIYYESNTYLLGKDLVEQGLQKNVFFQKDDGSV
ncbi:MAG TPA: arginine--tRNA ligase [Flavitalea sp.]|nr:arginine--tRNA ligase [Flavitalea sp.]